MYWTWYKHFIRDRNVNILGGYSTCEYNFGPLSDATLHKKGLPQKDNVNFESTKTLYTENIKVNDTETIYVTAYTNGLSSEIIKVNILFMKKLRY
ncbi:hypothetical protein SMSRO_SF029310 [Spiroplasma poulsonii]|uniref:Uncharacterized protein n=1 Tax=Spiroplasma poulsonii TaxID=2138 RepID=A0A2P6F8I4_9MOLU|nr:hypothetical protein SMSRO_SF029310 [Spiroplasma poulsonii]